MSLKDQTNLQRPLSSTYTTRNRNVRADVNPAAIVAPTVMASPPTVTFSNYTGASPLGANAVTVAYNSPRVTPQGCVPIDNATYGFRDNGANGADAGGTWAVEFDHYGAGFVYLLRSFDSTGGTYQIYSDGSPVASAPFVPTGVTVSAGGLFRMYVSFGTTALRRIRIQLVNAQYKGLEIGATDAISPTPLPAVRGVVFGDSFVGGALSIPQQNVFCATLGRILGWEMVNAGQGGTGYTHVGPGARQPYNDPVRISTAAAYNPDYVIIFGTVNDDGASSSAAVQSAAISTYAQFAAAAPNTKLIVVGPPPQHTTIPASRLVSQAAVKACAISAPNVIGFIDPIAGTWQAGALTGGDSQQWVTGTGWAGTSRTVTDGATTNASTTLTSATANFTSADVNRVITGAGIPANTQVQSVTNSTTAVLTQAATATASSVTITFTNGFGDGNADWVVGSDNVHPTQAGHDYYARRIAKAVMDIIASA